MAQYSSPRSPSPRARPNPDPLAQQAPLVSARWLLWSLAGIFGGGLALVYLSMCFLFWQGQWQILFHPVHPGSIIGAAAQGSFKFEEVRFGATESGHTPLDGFLVQALPGSPYAAKTILYLQDATSAGAGHTASTLNDLHQCGLAIFAFDYRGFGKSESLHPSEQSTTEDTEAAWRYLIETRHIAAASVFFYGQGLGASLAAEAAVRHPEAAGVILDSPAPTALELLRADPRSRWLPVRLLAHDRFNPRAALATLQQPKLFLLPGPDPAGKRYAQAAANPKLVVYLSTSSSDELRQDALRRFLDELPLARVNH